MYVCMYVCMYVHHTITFEGVDIGSSYLLSSCFSRKYESGSYVKVFYHLLSVKVLNVIASYEYQKNECVQQ